MNWAGLANKENVRSPNLQSVYREAMLYLKKRDWGKAEHLAGKALEKLDAAGRSDLSGRVRDALLARRESREYALALEKYGGGGC